MKRFLVYIIIGIITFSVVWGVAEMAISRVENEYSYKYNYVKNNPSIKTLLIGHSHFANSVNPYLMGDSIFDFAIAGRGWIYWDVKLAEQLFPTMVNLKTVIFPLSYKAPYSSAHYMKDLSEDEECIYMYAKYMNVPYDRFPQSITYSSALMVNKMGAKYWKEESQDALGYMPVYGQAREWKNEHNVEPTIYESDTAKLCYQEYRQNLIQLAKICHKNNIRFIVVTTPCADCYIENTRARGIKNLYDLVDSVVTYYPIEYYNYLADKEFRVDSFYFDCSHLNSIGADKFALRLKHDLGL